MNIDVAPFFRFGFVIFFLNDLYFLNDQLSKMLSVFAVLNVLNYFNFISCSLLLMYRNIFAFHIDLIFGKFA